MVDKARREVDLVMTLIKTRLQDAVLIAIEILLIARVELAMKSVNASSGRGVVTVVLDLDQGGFRETSKAFK